MKDNIKNRIRSTSLCLAVLLIIGCSGYTVIRKLEVPAVPDAGYERIIKLDNPEGNPDKTLAGVVHVTGRATVCTDYPRELIIKSLDDLTEMEKRDFLYFQNYVIKDGDEILGYVSVPIDYRAIIWRIEKDPSCKYKVQIIFPSRTMGHTIQNGADKSAVSR
jgi:hypothetical protein